MFVDFSSTFSTIQPNLMIQRSCRMNVSYACILCIHDFLTNRTQYVKIGETTSKAAVTNTGAPQGCVGSPILFAIYTSDCKSIGEESADALVKYTDDKYLAGFIHDDVDSTYRDEVEKVVTWCSNNYLDLNSRKTKELITDFRKCSQSRQPLILHGETVQQV